MLITQQLNDALNAQIGREMEASNQYLQIAAYFEGRYLKKLAELFFKQAAEEQEHALKFLHYVNDTNGKLVLPALAAPKVDFSSAEEAVALSLKWEQDVTGYIYQLMDIAESTKDYIAREFLAWFVTEQLEEVSSMDTLLGVIRNVGDKNLLMAEAYLSH